MKLRHSGKRCPSSDLIRYYKELGRVPAREVSSRVREREHPGSVTPAETGGRFAKNRDYNFSIRLIPALGYNPRFSLPNREIPVRLTSTSRATYPVIDKSCCRTWSK